MTLKSLNTIASALPSTAPMPALFVGHGNPMNAISDNEFVRGWRKVGESLPAPRAVLCISAHWQTSGTAVTAMEHPRTIHDFGGFPRALYEVKYPAPGSPQIAGETKESIRKTIVGLDQEWGLDHGCWSVALHLFPDASIPVIQLSLDYTKPAQWHYDLAKELSALRRKGILIVGSGNIVHNLGMMEWGKEEGFDWAVTANENVKKFIAEHAHDKLVNYESLGREMQLAVPTPEHYLPLLYVLALREEKDPLSFFNDKTELGSVSMTSAKIG